MADILLLNGPNLNLLGRREPDVYGRVTLAEIETAAAAEAAGLGLTLEAFQSNAESALIEQVHGAPERGVRFIIVNPAAYTHTSIALRDALAAVAVPFIEIHLSNVHRREAFRQRSCFSDLAVGVIAGLGAAGYRYAVQHAATVISESARKP